MSSLIKSHRFLIREGQVKCQISSSVPGIAFYLFLLSPLFLLCELGIMELLIQQVWGKRKKCVSFFYLMMYSCMSEKTSSNTVTLSPIELN